MPGIVTLNLLAGISWCLHNVLLLLNASVEAEQSGSYNWNLKQQQR